MEQNNRLVVLADNRSLRSDLETEHGLSVWLETPSCRYLLDTGASDRFVRNAEKLGIDLDQVDKVFLSHGHDDHTGGLESLFRSNEHARVLVSARVTGQTFYSARNGLHPIGRFDADTRFSHRIVWIDGPVRLKDGVRLFSCERTPFPTPKANSLLFADDGKSRQTDNFSHELFFALENDPLFVYTGCSHHGLLNILETVVHHFGRKPDLVLGGFHLPDGSDQQPFETRSELTELADQLTSIYPGTRFLTGHCTGDHAFTVMKEIMGDALILFHAGYSLNF